MCIRDKGLWEFGRDAHTRQMPVRYCLLVKLVSANYFENAFVKLPLDVSSGRDIFFGLGGPPAIPIIGIGPTANKLFKLSEIASLPNSSLL